MSDICLAVGASDSGTCAATMLACMARYGQETEVLQPETGMARNARLPGDKPLRNYPQGLTVSVDGKIFDAEGPLDDPAEVVAEHYRAGTLDRLAWLIGSFAAIVVDPAKHRSILATDRMGSRTLFVWRQARQAIVQDEPLPEWFMRDIIQDHLRSEIAAGRAIVSE